MLNAHKSKIKTLVSQMVCQSMKSNWISELVIHPYHWLLVMSVWFVQRGQQTHALYTNTQIVMTASVTYVPVITSVITARVPFVPNRLSTFINIGIFKKKELKRFIKPDYLDNLELPLSVMWKYMWSTYNKINQQNHISLLLLLDKSWFQNPRHLWIN